MAPFDVEDRGVRVGAWLHLMLNWRQEYGLRVRNPYSGPSHSLPEWLVLISHDCFLGVDTRCPTWAGSVMQAVRDIP
jgi:hypothetical protein